MLYAFTILKSIISGKHRREARESKRGRRERGREREKHYVKGRLSGRRYSRAVEIAEQETHLDDIIYHR